MRVHLIVHRFGADARGGTERYALGVARGLVAAGDDVTVFSYAPGPSADVRAGDERVEGIPVRRLSFRLDAAANPIREEFDSARVARFLRGEWQRARPDIVHLLHPGFLSTSPLAAAAELGIATVATLTDMWAVCPAGLLVRSDLRLCEGPNDVGWCARCLSAMGPRGRRYRALAHAVPTGAWRTLASVGGVRPFAGVPPLGWLADLARRRDVIRRRLFATGALTSPGRFLCGVLERNGYPAGSVRALPHGIEAPETLRRDAPPPDGACLRLGYVGPLAPYKGAHLPAAALALLPSDAPVSLSYWGALPDNAERDPYARPLLAAIAQDQRITHHGPYDADGAGDVLAAIDVLLVPSLCYENTPTIMYEAFASATPVIATDAGGMRELVEEFAGGWLVPRNDAGALAERLGDLLARPDAVHRAAAGIRAVPALADHVAALAALYEEVSR